jgi:hypothetical protein
MTVPTIVFGLAVFAIMVCLGDAGYSKLGPREKFEKTFEKTCSSYPFFTRYKERMARERNSATDEYVIYVFSEKGHGGNGGLGDRLGGLITAIGFALRTNRILLVQGDKPFEESFRPYGGEENKVTWNDWKWAGWEQGFMQNMTFNRGCVNPRPRHTSCAMDKEGAVNYPIFKVVKHRGNRAYLCRWAIRGSLGMGEELERMLGVREDTDLYEVAGCMLRLALWPTDLMWQTLDEWLESSMHAHATAAGDLSISTQVGFHFRCGDTSFGPSVSSNPNSQCVFHSKETWKGTAFSDDFSSDSPVDEAECGREILKQYTDGAKGAGDLLAYIASDNADSARQINGTLKWPLSLTPTDSCHVDLESNPMCSRMTFVQWFMLSLSDKIIMQSLKPNPDVNSPYHAVSDETKAADAVFKTYAKQGPISAFSRYASIYGLHKDILRYGLGCQGVNKTALSWQTQGNWLCGPKLFY